MEEEQLANRKAVGGMGEMLVNSLKGSF